MKKSIFTLAIIVATSTVNAQWLNRFSVQLEGGNHYDLFTPGMDANNVDDPVVDMQSLQGDNDRFDLNGAFAINYTTSPLWSVTLGYGAGTLSGSNGSEYYHGSIWAADMGVRFHVANLNPGSEGSPWVVTPHVLYTLNGFNSELFSEADNSSLNMSESMATGFAFGAEISYNINSNLSVYMSPQFRTVNSDGMDGWDYGTGSDHYMRTNLGVKYRFTTKVKTESGEEETAMNMSDVNMWSEEQLNKSVGLQEGIREDFKADAREITEEAKADILEQVEETTQEVYQILQERGEAIAEIERTQRELFIAVNKMSVFFEVDQSELDDESRRALFRFVERINQTAYEGKYTLVLTAHTDVSGSEERNQELRDERAAAVIAYLHDVLGLSKEVEVVVKTAPHDQMEDKTVDRRVDLSVEPIAEEAAE